MANKVKTKTEVRTQTRATQPAQDSLINRAFRCLEGRRRHPYPVSNAQVVYGTGRPLALARWAPPRQSLLQRLVKPGQALLESSHAPLPPHRFGRAQTNTAGPGCFTKERMP